jgi:enoyl-CoA hydratase/carnithine racemase
MGDQPRLLLHQDGAVLTVTFNNPPRHFFDARMAFELDELTHALKRDKSVRAVILSGTDNTYITHMDVPSLLHSSQASPIHIPYGLARAAAITGQLTGGRTLHRLLRKTPVASIGVSARIYAALRRMNSMDTVFVTAINGLAVGMGFIFAMACDVRIIADDAQIGLPEAGLGLLAAAGGTQRLVRMVGSSRALDMLLNGKLLTAQTAHQYGLVHHIAARSDLLQQASTSAHRLARQSPVINREIKRMIYQAADHRFASAIKTEAAGLITTITSRQARQNLDAYDRWLQAQVAITDEAVTSSFAALLNGRAPGVDEMFDS